MAPPLASPIWTPKKLVEWSLNSYRARAGDGEREGKATVRIAERLRACPVLYTIPEIIAPGKVYP